MKTPTTQLIENVKLTIAQAVNTCVDYLQIRVGNELVSLYFEYGARVTTVKVRFNFTFITRDFFHREFNEQVTQKIIRFIEQTTEGAAA